MSVKDNLSRRIQKKIKRESWFTIIQIYTENEIPLNFIVSKRTKRNIIHIFCKKLAVKELKYFKLDSYDFTIKDRDGNNCLSLFLKSCLKKHQYDRVDEVWKFIISKNQDIQNLNNFDGVSANMLLSKINKRIYTNTMFSRPSVEDIWKQDLFDEAESEYMEYFGRYEEDFTYEYNERYETHSDWADRIRREHYEKHHFTDTNIPNKNEEPNPQEDYISNPLEEECRQKLKAKQKNKQLYEKFRQKWRKFECNIQKLNQLNNDDVGHIKISENSLPEWPFDVNLLEVLTDYFESNAETTVEEAIKKELKLLQVGWHPDRFFHRCQKFIDESQIDLIKSKVVTTSQVINQLISQMK